MIMIAKDVVATNFYLGTFIQCLSKLNCTSHIFDVILFRTSPS